MVDSVRNSPNLGGLTVHDQKKSSVSSGQANQLPDNGNAQADKASVSVDLSISEKVSSLAGSPPINMELVNEIREKVQQGRYPIDLDAISSKLFESIQDAEGQEDMDIDKLLDSLAVISEVLKTPSLTNQIDQDPEFGIKIKEFETLVEKVKLQHGGISVSDEDFLKLLNELYLSIQEIDTYCDLNLQKLNFLENLRPLT